jgi:hypothetical protein
MTDSVQSTGDPGPFVQALRDIERWLGTLVVLALFVSPFIAVVCWNDNWFVKIRVQHQYCNERIVTECRVTIDQPTHDCEFFTAPMGSKHCHYERVVIVDPWNQKNLYVHYAKMNE